MEDFYRQKILSARVALKRSQIKINSLEGLIQTKTKENEELKQICLKLIEERDSKLIEIY
uniref:Transforming acidic coiled-coil-containing protein C-terminal domain-containing protein n=1 Tax=Meloidogyne enterolobii TaxID=390850 RepID=A0A6V7Y7M1_MELEN|nr:unnamed protein product [Meloidogyne enterolobii]